MGPDPRLARLLAAMHAVRDGDLGARAQLTGDDTVAELGALFDELADRDQATAHVQERAQAETLAARPDHLAERLAAASRAKAEFLANISHELRTPLSSLLILAKLLAANGEGNLTGQQVDFARTIHGAAQDLLQLINGLLDLSKVETGRMEVRADRVNLAALVPTVEAAFRPLAEEKGLELAVLIADDAPQFVDTDRQRLQQILRNLLSNAVKFTDHGKVSLEIGPDPDPRHAGEIRFAVRDTGVGIAAQQQQAIFEAFEQGDAAAGQRLSGTGLGLSISRELARLLNGSLRVGSVPGQGSTFTLSIPLWPSTPPAHGRAGTAHAQRAPVASVPTLRIEEHGTGTREPEKTTGAGGPSAPVLPTAVLVVEPRGARAMQHAARTALDGLGGMPGRVELMTLHDGAQSRFETVLTSREVVSVLVNLSTPRPQVQALLSAVAEYAPAVPVLVYEAGGGSGTAARLEASLGSAPQIEIVGSRAQAVERLTLHLLTALPGSAAELSLSG
ncbi:MAG: sensor histidine kinase, partial [Actinocrinis sp.]